MEGDPATLSIIGAGPFRHPFDRQRPAGGTDQRFLVPIRRDQNQRLWRAVLLDAPTSHSRPFWWGLMARIWLPHPTKFTATAAAAQRRRAYFWWQTLGEQMRGFLRISSYSLGLLVSSAGI